MTVHRAWPWTEHVLLQHGRVPFRAADETNRRGDISTAPVTQEDRGRVDILTLPYAREQRRCVLQPDKLGTRRSWTREHRELELHS